MSHLKINRTYEINYESVLAVFIVLPICLLIIFYDQILGNEIILRSLPENPSSLALYNLLFGLPHIIAGHLLVMNKEHRTVFRQDIVKGSIIVILSIILASYFLPLYISLTAFIVITLVHVLKQQFGLVKVFSSVGGNLVDLWSWLAIGVVGILASIFALKGNLELDTIRLWHFLVITLNVVFIILGGLIFRNVKTKRGKYFFLVNLLSVPTTTCFYFGGYTFFAILTVRVIHDTTAFMIYLVHEKNKNWSNYNSLIATILSIITVVIFSISLAYVLENYLVEAIYFVAKNYISFPIISSLTLSIIVYVEMMHYFLESKIWKKSSSCRKYVIFSI